MSASSVSHGCRAVLPDKVAASVTILMEEGKIAGTIQPQLQAFEGVADRAAVLGCHLEDPYPNSKYGARSKALPVRPFGPAEYGELIAHPLLRWWTCAPRFPAPGP